jgi:hypothetical protein
MAVNCCHLEIANPRKVEAIILSQMMAPKPSGDAVLGRHHPPIVPRTGTGIISTTMGYTIRTVFSLVSVQPFVVAR